MPRFNVITEDYGNNKMLVKDILSSKKICISYEFFPPKLENDWDGLFQTISDLIPLDPAYVSVTYGAGGSTRDGPMNFWCASRKKPILP